MSDTGKNKTLTTTKDGVGPVLMRHYSVLVADSPLTPSEVMLRIRRDFPKLAPATLAEFAKETRKERLLKLDDEMSIKMPLTPLCKVRVVQLDETTMTLQTFEGHPEAGRISFRVVRVGRKMRVHIKSRARSADVLRLAGYWLVGKMMQTRVWKEFLTRTAALAEGRADGPVAVATTPSKERRQDRPGSSRSTFSRPG